MLRRSLLLAAALVGLASPAFALSVDDSQSFPFSGTTVITPDVATTPSRSIYAICTVAGSVNLTLTDGTTLLWPVYVGGQTMPFGVKLIASAGTTSTCAYGQLK